MSTDHKSRKRIERLFAEMHQPAFESSNAERRPAGFVAPPQVERLPSPLEEAAALQARIRELEGRLKELESKSSSTFTVYEKEELGYAYQGGEILPLRGDQPQVQEEAKIVKTPLTAGGKAIGEVKVAQSPERPLTEEDVKLANAVAQQVSLQIENLRLLAAAERARAEAEEATRQSTYKNWDNFLDAIHNAERIGYKYDQAAVEPFAEPAPAQYDHEEIMQTLDQQIGRLFVQGNGSLMEEDKAFIGSIAKQVGQQVENIRLLADASRARAEAEEATRRLTHESWSAYASNMERLGFVYDLNEVIPLGNAPIPGNTNFVQPLVVRGETIGQLAVAGAQEIPPETASLAGVIAERVSAHLETLRLADELQKRAAELQTVAKLSTAVSTVLNPDELLQSVVNMTQERFGIHHAHIFLANESWGTLLMAAGSGEVGRQLMAEQAVIPLDAEVSLVARAARERQTIIVNDVRADPAFMPHPLLPETRSEMAVPMIVGDKIFGVFDVQSQQLNRFTGEDASIYNTLAAQVSVALQNARLYAEQSATLVQLRELDRLKSAFLANMSHELRTPLNSILGFTDVMLEGLDGDLTAYMDNDLRLIQKNGQHLLHLINDVLDMAKIESGRMNLHPENFLVHDLLEEVVSITSTLAGEKNLALFIEPDSDREIQVFADNTRIRQVMINLVNNSIKFTETGKVAIKAVMMDDARALITVKDTGIGIPPENLETIFQEFTQVDSSSTRKAGGTGLGLPISRRLVEIHGGRLWVKSAGIEGEGSTFFVELPLQAHIIDIVEKKEK